MRYALIPAAALIAAYSVSPAFADDKAACTDGITAIKAELAKNPPEPALGKAKKALRIAEREQKEGEFDECVEALDDARRALK